MFCSNYKQYIIHSEMEYRKKKDSTLNVLSQRHTENMAVFDPLGFLGLKTQSRRFICNY